MCIYNIHMVTSKVVSVENVATLWHRVIDTTIGTALHRTINTRYFSLYAAISVVLLIRNNYKEIYVIY